MSVEAVNPRVDCVHPVLKFYAGLVHILYLESAPPVKFGQAIVLAPWVAEERRLLMHPVLKLAGLRLECRQVRAQVRQALRRGSQAD